MPIFLMSNQVMRYTWGDCEAIPHLLGRSDVCDEPWAELWMGAHPKAPSTIFVGQSKEHLDRWIRENRQEALGDAVLDQFDQLPMLCKVLAAARPLSIQAHPNAEQAAAGFANENEQGVPIDAPHRNYRDPYPKPEMLLALEPFQVMAGFRPLVEIKRLFSQFELMNEFELLTGTRDFSLANFQKFFAAMLRADRESLANWISQALVRGPECKERRLIEELEGEYGADPGVLAPLYLRVFMLEPGEAIFLDAGMLHAYIHGLGVEVMRSSDNVLRGGLTPKHRDVDELMRIIDWRPEAPRNVTSVTMNEFERVYSAPVKCFRLSRIKLNGEAMTLKVTSPQIILSVDGECQLRNSDESLQLSRGESAFITAGTKQVTLDGVAKLYRFWPPM